VADIKNVSSGAFGGAITAALYLKELVPNDVPWAHFDMMVWNNASRPGGPEDGEAVRGLVAPAMCCVTCALAASSSDGPAAAARC